jgi:hypothetical protein
LVLRLNQETVHDFILLFMPPCNPHLTPLVTGSLERSLLLFSTPGGLTGDDLSRLFFTCTNTSQAASLLVFYTPGGLTGDDLSRLFFTCTNTSQAATCTCNT